MKKFLQAIFNQDQNPADGDSAKKKIQRATAALLIEVAISDQQFDESELVTLQRIIIQHCGLSPKQADALITEAKQAAKDSSSLYEFTQEINRHCSHEEKYILVEGLWRIAYADKVVDKYETHIIRRIADLIHISHADFIKAKQEARQAMN